MEFEPEVAETIPAEIRDHAFIKDAPDLPTLLKNAVETKNAYNTNIHNSIRIPGKDAKAEDVQKWWGETESKLAERGFLSLPAKSAEDYKLPEIEGLKADDALVKSFVEEVALSQKLSPQQFQAIVGFQHKMNQEFAKQIMTKEAAEAEFKAALGADYDNTMGQ